MGLLGGFKWRGQDQPIYSLTRLNALVDGIYAIVLTLLVIELHVPEGAGEGKLGEGIAELGREMAVYAFAFLQVISGWLATRRISAWSKGIDHWGTVLFIGNLAAFILFPFLTATVVAALPNEADLAVATRLWAMVLLVSFLFLAAYVRYEKRHGFFHDQIDPETLRLARLTASWIWVVPLIAFAASYVAAWIGLVTFALVSLVGLFPIDGHALDADAR